MSKKRGRQGRAGQNYDRTDRVSGLVREIVASELERIDDQRLFLLSITGVDVDRELSGATVWFYVSDDDDLEDATEALESCLLYTSPSPRDGLLSRMPSSA